MEINYVFLFTLVASFVYFSHCSIYQNLKYFETLHASKFTHHIVKRGVKLSHHPFNIIKELQFQTLGKSFRLILHPHNSVLHSNFKAYSVDADGNKSIIHIDYDHFYTGRVFGEKSSDVKLHIEEGVITGTIHTPQETYHIEPSWRHLPHLDDKTMITYRSSDIRFSWTNSRDSKPRVCGYVKEGKELEDDDDEDDYNENLESKQEQLEKDKYFSQNQNTDDKKPSLAPSEGNQQKNGKRVKRQSDYEYTPTKTRCPLLLVADYRFFQEMGASNTKTTISYLISLIDRVHKIYNDTVWQDRQDADGFKGMGFVIKKILVHSEPTRVRGGEAHYNMVREKWDVRNLLEVFSREYSHKDFCLAHLFTDLKFEGGILGLAYVGSPRRNSVGGICTPEYFKNGYTLYLNSGLSSSRNHYGQRVITREADLVTAHEFGHNWGSEHDPDVAECSPAASHGGSYLMYTYSVSGYDVNNKVLAVQPALHPQGAAGQVGALLLGARGELLWQPARRGGRGVRRGAARDRRQRHVLRQELQAEEEPGSRLQRQELPVLRGLRVRRARRRVPRGRALRLRGAGHLHRRLRRLPQGAGHRGRARVRGARALPQRLVRAVLRDAGPAQLHVRHRGGRLQALLPQEFEQDLFPGRTQRYLAGWNTLYSRLLQ
ncbi:ADAM 17-like protease isoform X2 [Vanessa atalanta]|uniref:ADAM 17-like protease isoform X2 n=1 Tax=Vanessa atalanta TaxID=42275 RepID=UPI001FCE086C|nr:ADAM 17-like protease isoform X2 [Vanessa atalanta]